MMFEHHGTVQPVTLIANRVAARVGGLGLTEIWQK
jgi:hypothetical protein